MVQDLIGYDILTQNALRGIIKQALTIVERKGLPAGHHFYITFKTSSEGVDIDEELSKIHPKEMTIILEHQFWDLNIKRNAFEVTLKFSGTPKFLRIPYSAVTRFHDPSIGFTLQFSSDEQESKQAEQKKEPNIKELNIKKVKTKKLGKKKPSQKSSKSSEAFTSLDSEQINWDEEVMKEDKTKKEVMQETAKIVSLDAYRKK